MIRLGTEGTPTRRTSNAVLWSAGVLICAIAATAAVCIEDWRLLSRSGLTGEYRFGTSWDGPPQTTALDSGLSSNIVRRHAREQPGSRFTVAWHGYIVAPARGRYRFVLLARDRAALDIDKRPLLEAGRIRRTAWIELARGLHPITIRYASGDEPPTLDLRFARGDGTPVEIPRLLLVPDLIPAVEARLRPRMLGLSSVLPIAWSTAAIALVAMLIVAICTFRRRMERHDTIQILALLVAAAVVFSVGLSWGLPDYRGWAVDEVTPGQVQDFVEHRFAVGWAGVYPPLHFGLLAVATAPVYASTWLGLVDDNLDTYSHLFVIGRVLSVAMALCILAMTFRIAADEFGDRAGRFAVLSAMFILPLTYYAKTANVDVSYLFWLAVAWSFYLRGVGSGRTLDYWLFAVAAAAAVATKDQAYGFFVLPAIHLIVGAVRGWPGSDGERRLTIRGLLTTAVVFCVTVLILFNVPFNLSGVREHLRVIVGPGSQPFRMYARTPAGYFLLVRDSISQIASAMSWPIFICGVMGMVVALRRGSVAMRRLALSALSYYVTFIAVVMYQYDRFFIGICLVLAMAAGRELDLWTRVGSRHRSLRLALVSVLVLYAGTRVVALDAMMLADSRYYVEKWLTARTGPDTRIAGEGSSIYLPRQANVFWTRIAPELNALATEKPDYLIVNTGYRARVSAEPAAAQFYAALADGTARYRRVLSYRSPLSYSPLSWERRFNRPDQDPFSNVSKVSPTIEVYERVPDDGPR